jgi:hypothetical protein
MTSVAYPADRARTHGDVPSPIRRRRSFQGIERSPLHSERTYIHLGAHLGRHAQNCYRRLGPADRRLGACRDLRLRRRCHTGNPKLGRKLNARR